MKKYMQRKSYNVGKDNSHYIDGRTLQKYYCKDCGKEIGTTSGIYGSGKCRSCANKDQNNPTYVFGITKKFLIKEYVKNRKSMAQLAEIKNCSQTAIKNRLKKYYIKIRIKNETWKGRHQTKKAILKMKRCKPFHHIDGNHNNNNQYNLIKLCSRSIHQKIFKIYYKFIKLQGLSKKFEKWLRKNYEIKKEVK